MTGPPRQDTFCTSSVGLPALLTKHGDCITVSTPAANVCSSCCRSMPAAVFECGGCSPGLLMRGTRVCMSCGWVGASFPCKNPEGALARGLRAQCVPASSDRGPPPGCTAHAPPALAGAPQHSNVACTQCWLTRQAAGVCGTASGRSPRQAFVVQAPWARCVCVCVFVCVLAARGSLLPLPPTPSTDALCAYFSSPCPGRAHS
jgi:hypothetical protein